MAKRRNLPITDEEHNKALSLLDSKIREYVSAIEQTGLYSRAKIHDMDYDVCVYFFRDKEHGQIRKNPILHLNGKFINNNIYLVFRYLKGEKPITKSEWDNLMPVPRHQSNEKWRAFEISSKDDLVKAKELANEAIKTFDRVYY
ncbi:MAG: hypothetical protein WBM02_12440 [bacterium]